MMTLYDDVMRTIIELPQQQLGGLDGLCRRDGVSRAEAIRRAVAEYLQRENPSGSAGAYGLWRGRRLDGVAYQRNLRREWDR